MIVAATEIQLYFLKYIFFLFNNNSRKNKRNELAKMRVCHEKRKDKASAPSSEKRSVTEVVGRWFPGEIFGLFN